MHKSDWMIAAGFMIGFVLLLVTPLVIVAVQTEHEMCLAISRTGEDIVVISVWKDFNGYTNSLFWVTAQKFNGEPEEQSTFRVDGEKSPVPQTGERWRIDRDWFHILFKKRLEAAR